MGCLEGNVLGKLNLPTERHSVLTSTWDGPGTGMGHACLRKL